MSETVYVRFKWDNFGYMPGDVVQCRLNERDNKGVHVTMRSPEDKEEINAWSDLGSFEELTAMEVIAHAAAGTPFL